MKESLHFAGLPRHIPAQCNSALAVIAHDGIQALTMRSLGVPPTSFDAARVGGEVSAMTAGALIAGMPPP
jgi:hypothetical protein